MINLLKIEWLKLRHYPVFWIMLVLYFLGMAGMAYGLLQIQLSMVMDISVEKLGLYEFPRVFHTVTYVCGFFFIFIAIIILLLTTNEYTYKTFRQSIINGQSKGDILKGKILVIFSFSLVTTFFVFLMSLLLGAIFTEEGTVYSMTDNLKFFPAFFMQLFSFLSFAMMIGILVKKTAIGLMIVLLYYLFFEGIIKIFLPEGLVAYMPIESIDAIIQIPLQEEGSAMPIESNGNDGQMSNPLAIQPSATAFQFVIISVWTFVYLAVSALLLRKRDL